MMAFKLRLLLIATIGLLTTGCANRALMYQWGGYDAMLYRSYKNPEKTVELQQGLERHISALEQAQQRIAPGLYAELGTLYLQAGDGAKAASLYEKERKAWPESKALMDALIQNVNKPAGEKAEIKP